MQVSFEKVFYTRNASSKVFIPLNFIHTSERFLVNLYRILPPSSSAISIILNLRACLSRSRRIAWNKIGERIYDR